MRNTLLIATALCFFVAALGGCANFKNRGENGERVGITGDGANDGTTDGGAGYAAQGFDVGFYTYSSNETEFLTVEITNNSGRNYRNLLLTLSFSDGAGTEIFEYDAGIYVNFETGRTVSVWLRPAERGFDADSLYAVSVKSLREATY